VIHHGTIRTSGTLEALRVESGAASLAEGFLVLLGEAGGSPEEAP